MLFALKVIAFVTTVVSPSLLALAVLQIILPVPLVGRSVLLLVNAKAVRSVVEPLASVRFAVSVIEGSFPARFIVHPVPDILRPIRPDLSASAVAFVTNPLAVVSGAAFEEKKWALFSRQIGRAL